MPLDTKRASWLELFYDVAFVALVAQLTYLAYEHHHTITDLYTIFIVGYTIFIAWWATTANRNLQPSETATDKFFIQVQMVAAFLMSLTMTPVFSGEYLGFFLTFGLLRFLQSFMLIRMYYVHPGTRPATYNILEGLLVGATLWIITAFVPAPYHFILAGAALLVDILTPLTRGKGNTTRYLNVYHLQERLGLFMMLVIGESMIVVALSNTADSFSLVETSIVFSGLFMMIALWWLYFEHSDDHQGVRPRSLFVFLHAHGFLFGSIILLSVGYKLAITAPRSLEAFSFVAAGSLGIAVTLITIRLMIHPMQKQAALLVTGFFLLGIGVLYIGFEDVRAIEATLAVTALFGMAAIFDRWCLFSPREKTTPGGQTGFTLIELLVVIAIIGILASVALASLNDARISAQYTVVQQETKTIVDALTVAGNPNQSLIQLTGSICTMCTCSDGFGLWINQDLRNVPESSACYQTWVAALQSIAAVSPLLDETGGPRRDPWGSPYLLDENENEPGYTEPCRPDTIQSVGPDGQYLTADDYIVLIPFRTSNCRGNTDAFFFNTY